MELVKIPANRVSSLIGKKGGTKSVLEERLKVKITVSKEGDVEVDGEPLEEFVAKDVVKAVGRGFEPEIALKLVSDRFALKIVNLREFSHSEKEKSRMKGRIIGMDGKAKHIIEQDADCQMAVYGNTVAIIAPLETIEVAVNAVFKIMQGQPHSAVYMYLEKAKKRMKEESLKESLGISL
ncbi:hypothetical protein AUJ17_00565 [Candidatus Micrarchaeota archaeon CG1_02_47_40]|nr:MAG: hypothetical protein AUJ17_00565 [Candidatus Micrarchaeota archaeon CG1_02_47_40]